MFDIVCSQCGAHDLVPFRPRPGRDVKCRTCYRPDDRPQGGRTGPKRAPKPKRQTWTIKCAECGEPDEVPFEPRPESEVFCRTCHEARQSRRDQHRAKRGGKGGISIPRVDHGTRVSYPINCDKCGKHEVLTRVPSPTGPILCTECAEKRFGRTWYNVKSDAEEERSSGYEVVCATCGSTERLPFVPKEDREYECRRCYRGEVEADSDRLEGFEPLVGGVKVRHS